VWIFRVIFWLIPGPQESCPEFPPHASKGAILHESLAPVVMHNFGLPSMKESKVRGGNEKLLCINTHWAIRVSIVNILILQKGMLHFAITVSDSTFSLCPSNIQGTPSLLRHPT
jgi:hypothetical protein